MAEYIDLDLSANADELQQTGRDYLIANAPDGYVINPLVDWILGAVARMVSILALLAGQVPLEIFRYFGQSILHIAAQDAIAATGIATFTAINTTGGYVIPAGAQIDVNGNAVTTTDDITFTAGSAVATGSVIAITAGAAPNGETSPVQLVSPTFVWLSSVALTGPLAGGVDAETDRAYVDRLADTTPRLSTAEILLEDFATAARDDAEVYRALAIDNFVPPSTTGVEGAVTIALQDSTGQPVSTPAKTRVETALEANRVLAIDVHVIDPTYTSIDVAFTATVYPGFDPAQGASDGQAAIADFLDPARWGTPANDTAGWIDEPLVRRNDLFGVLYSVQSIRHVTALTLAITGNALGTADLTLNAPAGVPEAGTITGTVS